MSKFQTQVLLSAGLSCSLLLSSCVLPPRQAWQRIKDEGVMRALFLPKRKQPVTYAPQLAGVSSDPASGSETRGPASTEPSAPVAEAFPGRPGFVYSPHTTPKKLVNVKGFAAGEQVLCPHTMEPFIVPDFGQGGGSSVLAQTRGWKPSPATPRLSSGPAAPKISEHSIATSNPAVVEVVSNDPATPLLPEPSAGPEYGTWVEGKPGFVYSPYAAKHQLVDVAGIAGGVEVKCPYSGRIFRVPELPASSSAAPLHVPTLPEAGGESTTPATTPGSEPVPANPPATEPSVPVSPAPRFGGQPGNETEPAPSSPIAPVETPLPTAQWVEGQLNLVQSPFGKPGELVDVAGRSAGEKVVCPYTGKAFLVPAKTQ